MKKKIEVLRADKTAKEGEDIKGCQDAFKTKNNSQFAIADGASTSFFPKVWADMLVENFCEHPNLTEKNWIEWLQPLQAEWLQSVTERVQKAKNEQNPCWIEYQNGLNLQKAGASTFVGLQIKDHSAEIAIIGDSCLFIWHDNKFVESLIYKNSSEFAKDPSAFASLARNNTNVKPVFIDKSFEEAQEIIYVLATDALSKWILDNIEANKDVLSDLLNIDFEQLISDARKSTEIKLKNDDVALIIVKLSNLKTKIKKNYACLSKLFKQKNTVKK
ncbi:hypothetical protein AGMMS49525_14800 [Bacteroidia bacterium]|nr:hypothetical protein AGMMS49525_14800 [Bacteroidia bacterium]